jgi:hypothetical protein
MSACVLCLLTGDAAGAASPSDRVRIATAPMEEGAGQLTAYLGETLHGRVNANGTACFWVGDTDPTAFSGRTARTPSGSLFEWSAQKAK